MSLLVPVDLSAPSRCAIGLGAEVGAALRLDAVLLHVAARIPPLDDLARLWSLAEPLRLVGLRARLSTAEGLPADGICREARDRSCTWVVMGTSGRAGEAGSVARAVLGRCPVPVVAVRPGRFDGTDWVARARHAGCTRVHLESGTGEAGPEALAVARIVSRALKAELTEGAEDSKGGSEPDVLIVEQGLRLTTDIALERAWRCPGATVILVAPPHDPDL